MNDLKYYILSFTALAKVNQDQIKIADVTVIFKL